ncbi:hypothetical protein J6590_017818 [Homalodisca vitripennis]|nr:hypothetical protein J6590_017818 [Homalodisca vitripennis]
MTIHPCTLAILKNTSLPPGLHVQSPDAGPVVNYYITSGTGIVSSSGFAAVYENSLTITSQFFNLAVHSGVESGTAELSDSTNIRSAVQQCSAVCTSYPILPTYAQLSNNAQLFVQAIRFYQHTLSFPTILSCLYELSDSTNIRSAFQQYSAVCTSYPILPTYAQLSNNIQLFVRAIRFYQHTLSFPSMLSCLYELSDSTNIRSAFQQYSAVCTSYPILPTYAQLSNNAQLFVRAIRFYQHTLICPTMLSCLYELSDSANIRSAVQ